MHSRRPRLIKRVDPTAIGYGSYSSDSGHQSSKKPLNRSGDSSVQQAVCRMFLC
jgi:hypothetical protein